MVKSVRSISFLLILSLTFGLIAGCESDAQTGSLLGAGLGAGIGALAGGDSEATLIGAAAGGAGGYMLGNESDKKKAKAERQREINELRSEQNTVTVWVTNTNGSKIPVQLRKSGPNYIGPNGETYSSMPSEDQLRPVYGF